MQKKELHTAVTVAYRVAQLSLLSGQAAKAINEVKFIAYQDVLSSEDLVLLNNTIDMLERLSRNTKERDCISLIENL